MSLRALISSASCQISAFVEGLKSLFLFHFNQAMSTNLDNTLVTFLAILLETFRLYHVPVMGDKALLRAYPLTDNTLHCLIAR